MTTTDPAAEAAAHRPAAEGITRAFGDARLGPIAFVGPIHRAGHGWRFSVDLPPGVTVADVAAKRATLAHGLGVRTDQLAVDPTCDGQARRIEVWVRDAAQAETIRLTADVVLLADRDGELHVLLIQRRHDPFAGCWALPGGHVDTGEEVGDAAHRELGEETGLAVDDLDLVGVYSSPGRDPRGRYVTWAYVARVGSLNPTAGDDACDARWVPVSTALAGGLVFDHAEIVADAVAHVRA